MSMRRTEESKIIGKRYGNLEILRYHHSDKLKLTHWVVKCDCGRVFVARGTYLAKGYLRSCGCPVTEDMEIDKAPVTTGEKVRFDPFECMDCQGSMLIHEIVTGKVVMVNDPHKWFSVVYGNNLRTSFNYADIGTLVTVCGR